MTQLTDNIFCVEVPDEWQNVELYFQPSIHDLLTEKNGCSELIMWYTPKLCGSPRQRFTAKLPRRGTWTFLFTTKGATEEQAASIVQMISNGKISGKPQYRRYDRDLTKDIPAQCWTRDPRHSMETLLVSNGLSNERNYAILKLNDNGTE